MGSFISHVASKSNILLALALLWLTAAMTVHPAAALEQRLLSPDQFLVLAEQRKIIGEYTDGRGWQEKFLGDGTTIYEEEGIQMSGEVSAKGQFVCFEYMQQSGLVGGCFEIWQRSKNCFDFYGTDGSKKRTVATERQKRLSLVWSARGWFSNEPSTCTAAQIS